jgi:hypothetical protein
MTKRGPGGWPGPPFVAPAPGYIRWTASFDT